MLLLRALSQRRHLRRRCMLQRLHVAKLRSTCASRAWVNDNRRMWIAVPNTLNEGHFMEHKKRAGMFPSGCALADGSDHVLRMCQRLGTTNRNRVGTIADGLKPVEPRMSGVGKQDP